MKNWLRALGVSRIYWALRRARTTGPTYFANWLFQRVIGINRDCPWSVHFTSRVMHPRRIRIHLSCRESFAFSGGCYIQGTNGIEIGEGAIFAPGVKITSANHDMKTLENAAPSPPVKIGRRCWLGATGVISPGVTLGDHVLVGAGSIVTKSFPSNVLVAGVPARLVRQLASTQLRKTNPAAASATFSVQR